MSVTAKCLVKAQSVANSATVYYTVPSATQAIIDKFTLVNTDASSRLVWVYLVPSGGTPGATNLIVDALSIASKGTPDLSIYLQNQILNAGDEIAAYTDAPAVVNIRVSGREITA